MIAHGMNLQHQVIIFSIILKQNRPIQVNKRKQKLVQNLPAKVRNIDPALKSIQTKISFSF